MNIYRIDLYPHAVNKIALFDENHNHDTVSRIIQGTWSTSIQCGRVLDFSYMENEVTSNIHSQSVSIHLFKGRILQYLHSYSIKG